MAEQQQPGVGVIRFSGTETSICLQRQVMGDSFSLGVIFSFISTLLISTGYIHLAVRNVRNEIKHLCPLYITQLRHLSTYTL